MNPAGIGKYCVFAPKAARVQSRDPNGVWYIVPLRRADLPEELRGYAGRVTQEADLELGVARSRYEPLVVYGENTELERNAFRRKLELAQRWSISRDEVLAMHPVQILCEPNTYHDPHFGRVNSLTLKALKVHAVMEENALLKAAIDEKKGWFE